MSRRLSTAFDERVDCFNSMRFLAASMVLVGHSFELSYSTLIDPFHSMVGYGMAAISVDIFFVISGFLVTGSLMYRNSVSTYVINRSLRIYPGLIIAVFFCVFIVGLFFTQLSAFEYIREKQTLSFLFGKSTIFGLLLTGGGSDLPLVFLDNPYPEKVNGSLWTLPWEMLMYTILFLLGTVSWCLRLRSDVFIKATVLLLAAFCISVQLINHYTDFIESRNLKHALRFGGFFFSGSVLYVLREKIIISSRIFSVLVICLVFSLFDRVIFYPVYLLLLAYLVVNIAYLPQLVRQGQFINGDYSYGMYIYAFPIQQSCAVLLDDPGVFTMIIVSFPVTLIAAVLSWNFIERLSLNKKSSISNLLPSMPIVRRY